ncbi:MAG: selenide, water dikinase SelD, partial [Hyphomicrobiaceae bacterium]
RLRAEAAGHDIAADDFHFTVIGSGDLLPTHNRTARSMARRTLERAGIAAILGAPAIEVGRDHIGLADGRSIRSDATLITTKAKPPHWFADTGLDTDEAGFLAVRPTLQSTNDDQVFAAGDCATVLEHRREKAGVFAVRQGPPLVRNLRLLLNGKVPRPFKPQRHFLTLLSEGDRSAIAARGPFAARGRWAWTWKDHIDRAFMHKFQVLPSPGGMMTDSADDMACAGCAAKLGPVPLANALDRLPAPPPGLALADLASRDDAAVLDLGPGPLRLESVDYFPALWPEPYVLGQIAAAHGLSDILAMGGKPDHALAVATIPERAPHLAEDDLVQLLAGARSVFDRDGVALVGGHTSRGDGLAVGFFVSGTAGRDRVLAKSGLQAGDVLVLTKALGSGILFRAWMQGKARARHIRAALLSMRESNAQAARIFIETGARSATDITGFGLVGHLLEMLASSTLRATVSYDALPRFPGVDELVQAGVRSSLFPDNLAKAQNIELEPGLPANALALLLDPQTSGGLLAGLRPERAAKCLERLSDAGIPATIIGHIDARKGATGPAPVSIVSASPPATHTAARAAASRLVTSK